MQESSSLSEEQRVAAVALFEIGWGCEVSGDEATEANHLLRHWASPNLELTNSSLRGAPATLDQFRSTGPGLPYTNADLPVTARATISELIS